MIKKCKCCKDKVVIEKNCIENAIYYDGETYHNDCFHKTIEETLSNKRIKEKRRNLWLYAKENIEEVLKESQDFLKKQLVKDDIYHFIRYQYSIEKDIPFPYLIWHKLDEVYNVIPPDQLYDMWQQKISFLNKTRAIKESKDAKFKNADVFLKIRYDLAVLLNKYDSYCKWLRKQEATRIQEEKSRNNQSIHKTISNLSSGTNDSASSDNTDIVDLVDDIFGTD